MAASVPGAARPSGHPAGRARRAVALSSVSAFVGLGGVVAVATQLGDATTTGAAAADTPAIVRVGNSVTTTEVGGNGSMAATEPTTSPSTTVAPTTAVPPTTVPATTEAPTTAAPVTAAPTTTRAPVTTPPTTAAPVTTPPTHAPAAAPAWTPPSHGSSGGS